MGYDRVSKGPAVGVVVWCAALACGLAWSAPPTADYLLPAGGCRGTSVTVAVGGKPGDSPLTVDVEGGGIVVKPGEEAGKLLVEIDAEAAPGRRWIRLSNAEGSTAPLPFVVGTLEEIAEAEPNDAPQQVQPIDGLPRTVNGQIGKGGDVDTFEVALEGGERLVAVLDAHTALGSPMDGVMQILSPAGFVLAQNDDERGLDPALVFEAPSEGRYQVRLFAFPAQPNQSISFAGSAEYVYRLTLTTGAYVDRARPMSVRRGESTAIELDGWNLTDAMRSQIVTAGAEDETVVLFHPDAAGSVAVPVVQGAVTVYGEAAEESTPLIDAPATVTGCLAEAGQEDVIRLVGKKDQTLSFRVAARQLGYSTDPVLCLRDGEGKVLQEVDDAGGGRDAAFDFKFPADGEFDVAVRDLHGTGSPRHVYRLEVTPVAADFELSVGANSYVLKGGEALEVEVAVSRLHGFAGAIEIGIEGLPEDVAVAQATSAAEGDSAKKVTLKLESTGDAWSGLVRIVGRCAEPEMKRHAKAALKVEGETTDRIWLTRTAKPSS